jgi:FkbM family methyltransferase
MDVVLSSPLLVYGAGTMALEICRLLAESNFAVVGVIDDKADSMGKIIGPFQVCSTDDWLASHEPSKVTVVLAIHNPFARVPTIERRLRDRGFQKILNVVEFYRAFPGVLADHYWLTAPGYYSDKKETIQEGRALFIEDKSRDLYDAIIAFRMSGDYALLQSEHSWYDQYLPSDLPHPERDVYFVDCGAYTGDTIERLIEAGYHFKGLIAFEPDPKSYDVLAKKFSTMQNAIFAPCGLSSVTEQLRFSLGQGTASAVSETGDSLCQCIALDQFAPSFPATYVKMDVEGAEPRALEGAQRLISVYRPWLAISVYHAPDHLWSVPLLLDSWQLDYEYYLRSHAENTFETVLYAIPKR